MGRADVEARAKRDADIVRAKERAAAEAEEAERMAAHLLTVVDGKIESAEATVAEGIDRQGQARADHEAAIAARARAEEVEHTHDPEVMKAAIANTTVGPLSRIVLT